MYLNTTSSRTLFWELVAIGVAVRTTRAFLIAAVPIVKERVAALAACVKDATATAIVVSHALLRAAAPARLRRALTVETTDAAYFEKNAIPVALVVAHSNTGIFGVGGATAKARSPVLGSR